MRGSELCELEEYENYAFELCGEKLFVWGGPKDDSLPKIFVGAYDLR
jgi:hypothetical protein